MFECPWAPQQLDKYLMTSNPNAQNIYQNDLNFDTIWFCVNKSSSGQFTFRTRDFFSGSFQIIVQGLVIDPIILWHIISESRLVCSSEFIWILNLRLMSVPIQSFVHLVIQQIFIQHLLCVSTYYVLMFGLWQRINQRFISPWILF